MLTPRGVRSLTFIQSSARMAVSRSNGPWTTTQGAEAAAKLATRCIRFRHASIQPVPGAYIMPRNYQLGHRQLFHRTKTAGKERIPGLPLYSHSNCTAPVISAHTL